MKKYIHYCWFGNKKIPKLALKCIESWKKYLPEYEIMLWNEKNFDVNITNFSKQAYDNNNWAFVSDVARVYALKKYGGIYFDTDMIIMREVPEIIDNEFFAGWESEYNVAVGVLGVKNPENEIINKLWDFYSTHDFDSSSPYSVSIPTILTRILKSDYKLNNNHLMNQEIKPGFLIYSRDYFYPISCDNTMNMFTENTCMIHYYVGSWLPREHKIQTNIYRLFGLKKGKIILKLLIKGKSISKKAGRLLFYPYLKYRNNNIRNTLSITTIEEFKKQIPVKSTYLVICHKNWLGTSISTGELFDNVVQIEELVDDEVIAKMSDEITKLNIKLLVFSAFAIGWEKLILKVKEKNPSLKIKVIWHGSNALNIETYDWKMFNTLLELHDDNVIDKIAFVKKSMYEFYKLKNYRVDFLMNTVRIDSSKFKNNKDNNKTLIGLYASGDRWVKNFFNQLCAASLLENSLIDCVPISSKIRTMAKHINANIIGTETSLPRDVLLHRLSQNDINLYVTFTECAPLLPLESLELGVPCITSNNHHYWEKTELEKYLVVNENDNVLKIHEKIDYCLAHKEEIIKLYKNWKLKYDKKSAESVRNFLKD